MRNCIIYSVLLMTLLIQSAAFAKHTCTHSHTMANTQMQHKGMDHTMHAMPDQQTQAAPMPCCDTECQCAMTGCTPLLSIPTTVPFHNLILQQSKVYFPEQALPVTFLKARFRPPIFA